MDGRTGAGVVHESSPLVAARAADLSRIRIVVAGPLDAARAPMGAPTVTPLTARDVRERHDRTRARPRVSRDTSPESPTMVVVDADAVKESRCWPDLDQAFAVDPDRPASDLPAVGTAPTEREVLRS